MIFGVIATGDNQTCSRPDHGPAGAVPCLLLFCHVLALRGIPFLLVCQQVTYNMSEHSAYILSATVNTRTTQRIECMCVERLRFRSIQFNYDKFGEQHVACVNLIKIALNSTGIHSLCGHKAFFLEEVAVKSEVLLTCPSVCPPLQLNSFSALTEALPSNLTVFLLYSPSFKKNVFVVCLYPSGSQFPSLLSPYSCSYPLSYSGCFPAGFFSLLLSPLRYVNVPSLRPPLFQTIRLTDLNSENNHRQNPNVAGDHTQINKIYH